MVAKYKQDPSNEDVQQIASTNSVSYRKRSVCLNAASGQLYAKFAYRMGGY